MSVLSLRQHRTREAQCSKRRKCQKWVGDRGCRDIVVSSTNSHLGRARQGRGSPARHGSKGSTDIRRGPSPAPEERGRLRAQHPKAGTEPLGNEVKCTGLKK